MNSPRLAARGPLRPEVAPDTTFKLIGLGGVGSIVARYLAVFLGSLREDLRLVLIDGDDFEPSNATRKLVSDFCAENREDIALFSGGNDDVEAGATGSRDRGTFGTVQVHLRRARTDLTPALTAHHPEIAQPADKLPSDLNCTELIASTPQILFANLAAASAILNALWLYLCGSLHYSEVVFDIGEALMRPVE